MTSAVSGWREARARKRAKADAQHMVAESRRILAKKSYRIPEAVATEIEASNQQVEAAIAADDHERLHKEATELDEKVDKHLAFARKSSVREYGESIFVAIGIAILLRAFVVEAFQIPSGSMIPTLEVGDHIFVSKFSYGFVVPFTNMKVLQYAQPKRGDVIVFKQPQQTDVDYIKRVIGLPGDKVEVKRNAVFLNDQPIARQLLQDKPCGGEPNGDGGGVPCERWLETVDGKPHVTLHDVHRLPIDYGPTIVPPGNVFVMGDNRDNSNDSRVWGTVPEELIKGRALIIWWSRRPSEGGLGAWFGSIRWGRFFQLVK